MAIPPSVHALGGEAVEINEANFPDPVFRSVISGPEYDTDGNGILDAIEISMISNIYCEGMGITSLKGVEHFTALQGLWCKDNLISSMDLSNNPDLHGVWCSGNLFTSLDFSANPELEWVYCYDCNLTYLNISNNPKMAYVECNSNPLASLDVTHNPLLEHLTCGSCELTSLDLSNNPELSHLDAFRNHLTFLDVSHNPKMKRLDIWDNPGLGSIDVSHNPGLQYYNCANNDASVINVSANPQLVKLICSYNDISVLDISHNPKLVYLDCACNRIASLDLSASPGLYFLQAFTNPLTSLNIENNPYLVKAYREGTKKSEYAVCQGHSWTIDRGGDTSTGGDNIYFLCFDDAVTLYAGNAGNDSDIQADGSDLASEADGYIARETVIWTLYHLAGEPDVTGLASRFKDVEKGAWYEKALLWGEANAMCTGYPDDSSDAFGVGRRISRQDLLYALMRYSESMDLKRAIDFGRSDEYADYYDIDYYAWEAVCWGATWGIFNVKGDPDAPKSEQMIDPKGDATRADLEFMLRRMYEVNSLAAPSVIPIPDMTLSGGSGADTSEEAALNPAGADEVPLSDAMDDSLQTAEEETMREDTASEDPDADVTGGVTQADASGKGRGKRFFVLIPAVLAASALLTVFVKKKKEEK